MAQNVKDMRAPILIFLLVAVLCRVDAMHICTPVPNVACDTLGGLSLEYCRNRNAEAMSYYDMKDSAMNDIRSKSIFKIVANTLRKNKQCRDKYSNLLKTSGYIAPSSSDLRAFLRDDVSKKVLAAKAEEAIYALFTVDDVLSIDTLINADQSDLDLYLRPVDLPKYNEIMILRANKGLF